MQLEVTDLPTKPDARASPTSRTRMADEPQDPPSDLPAPLDEAEDIAPLAELTPAALMRCADVEDRLARGWSRAQVEHWLAEKHAVQPRQARRIFKQAEERWAREAKAKGREERVNQLERTTWATIRAALEREAMALDRDGGEHYYKSPDAGAAIRGLEFLARLRGDMQQPGAGIILGFGDEAMKAIAQIYGAAEAAPATVADAEGETVERLPGDTGDGG